jgi:hypothetical protein
MRTNLSERISNLWDNTKSFLWKVGTRYVLPAYILVSLASHNGCMDSRRTKNARYLQKPSNPTKTVAIVTEEWRDNSEWAAFSAAMGGGGYNPRVIRTVIFDDGSTTTLDYRVMAHQPFRRWISGEEFDPKPGEKYEVTRYNTIAAKRE